VQEEKKKDGHKWILKEKGSPLRLLGRQRSKLSRVVDGEEGSNTAYEKKKNCDIASDKMRGGSEHVVTSP